MSISGRSLDVYESSSSELKPIYKIQGGCGSRLKDFFCPRLPFGPCRGTTYKIIDQRGPPQRDDDLEPGATVVDNFDTGMVSTEWSHCTKELCSRGTHYSLRFPRSATVDQKILLVSAVMMLDMSFNEGGCLFC